MGKVAKLISDTKLRLERSGWSSELTTVAVITLPELEKALAADVASLTAWRAEADEMRRVAEFLEQSE